MHIAIRFEAHFDVQCSASVTGGSYMHRPQRFMFVSWLGSQVLELLQRVSQLSLISCQLSRAAFLVHETCIISSLRISLPGCHIFTRFRPFAFAPFLTLSPSLPPCLPASLPACLPPSLPASLSASLPASLPPSLPPSLSLSVPLCLSSPPPPPSPARAHGPVPPPRIRLCFFLTHTLTRECA